MLPKEKHDLYKFVKSSFFVPFKWGGEGSQQQITSFSELHGGIPAINTGHVKEMKSEQYCSSSQVHIAITKHPENKKFYGRYIAMKRNICYNKLND